MLKNRENKIQIALNSLSYIDECLVKTRKNNCQELEVIAYIVPATTKSSTELNEKIQSDLSDELLPLNCVLIPSLPLNKIGDIDVDLLFSLPVIDIQLINEVEKTLSAEKTLAVVAFLIERRGKRSGLYLPDFLTPKEIVSDVIFAGKDLKHDKLKNNHNQIHSGNKAITYGDPLHKTLDSPKLLTDMLLSLSTRVDTDDFIFIDETGAETTLSYGELYKRASSICCLLQQKNIEKGHYAIFQFESNIDFIVVFWGCLLAGIIPIPLAIASSYSEINPAVERLANVSNLFVSAAVILTSLKLEAQIIQAQALFDSAPCDIVAIDTSVHYDSDNCQRIVVDINDTAFVMLTSGSTGEPKGACISHDNLVSQCMSTCIINQLSADMPALNWMSLDHVAGLVMYHLRSMYLGCQQIHVVTDYILNQPLRWLDLLEKHQVGVTFAPNFAYALIVERGHEMVSRQWDLSATKLFQNGGEAVSVHTARRFIEILTPFDFHASAMCPAWGMSETTSGFTFNNNFLFDNTSDDDPYVSVGRAMPGNALRIVDENNQVLDEGVVGRLQVYGSAVFSGYYTGGELNTSCFTGDGWLVTGDLGFIDAANLTITGREKDVIIIGGVNYSGIAIETSISTISGIKNSFIAAVSVPHREQNGQECLAILFVPEDYYENEKLRYIFQQIRLILGKKNGVIPEYIVPLEEIDFLKTSIGKIQRTKMQLAFVAGEYDLRIREFELLVSSKNTLSHWFTEKKWQRQNIPTGVQLNAVQNVLYIGNNQEIVTHLQNKLNAVWLKSGQKLKINNDREWEINFVEIDDYVSALTHFNDVDIIIYDLFDRSKGLYSSELDCSIYQTNLLMVLLKSIGQASLPKITKLLCMGKRARQVLPIDNNQQPANSTAIGLLHSANIEQNMFRAVFVDFDDQDNTFIVNAICDEISSENSALEVAYRKENRYIPAITPFDPNPDIPSKLVMNGCYLVSGGLGGIGFHVAQYLLNEYQATVIIVGRSSVSDIEINQPAKNQLLEQLETFAGHCYYLSVDITDKLALHEQVNAKLKKLGRSLNGIFHLAGSLNQSLLADITADDIQLNLAAKIQGTNNLYLLLQCKKAIFVAFSSIRSVMPAATLGIYAAANIYLDEFVLNKNNLENPRCYGINWSAWHDTGLMANVTEESSALEHMGILELSVEKGISSLAIILSQAPGQYIIGLDSNNIQIQKLSHQLPAQFPVIQALVETDDSNDLKGLNDEVKDRFGTDVKVLKYIKDKFPRTSSGEIDRTQILEQEGVKQKQVKLPQGKIENEIASLWKDIFQQEKVSADWNFFEMGGNSIMITRLVAGINDLYHSGMTMKDVFVNPTIEAQALAIENNSFQQSDKVKMSQRSDNVGNILAVSSSQSRLWFMDRIEPGNSVFHVYAAIESSKAFEYEKLKDAVSTVVKRHEILRTCFVNEHGIPFQKISAEVSITLPVVVSSTRQIDTQIISDEINKPFDLEKDVLIRFLLIKTAKNKEILFITMHHIISDGWSMKILLNELTDIYFMSDTTQLPSVPLHYADFSVWQSQQINDNAFKEQVSYWQQKLQHHLNGFSLPLDKPRPVIQSYNGERFEQQISGSLFQNIKSAVKEHNVTPFIFLLTSFNSMLSRYTQERDIIVGTVAANRDDISIQKTIGFFINPLVLHTEIESSNKFSELLKEIQKVVVEAYDNHDIPFESLVEILQPVRDTSRPPLFQIVFDVRDPEITKSDNVDIKYSVMEPFIGKVQYDLHLVVTEVNNKFNIYWDYNTDLFEASSISSMARNFSSFLSCIVKNTYQTLTELQIISDKEMTWLKQWNSKDAPYAVGKCMHQLFEEHAQRSPQQPALSQREISISYAELNALANQWARYLLSQGVTENTIIGLCFNRSIEMVVSILAVLKIGGAYLALDPGYPEDRLQFMIDDTKPEFLITNTNFLDNLSHVQVPLILMENALEPMGNLNTSNIDLAVTAESLAYIIYTSGSTGRPKGVLLEHKGWCNVAQSQIDSFGLIAGMRVLQFASWSFDASAFEFAMAYGSGGTLVLGDIKGFIPGLEMARFLQQKQIEVVTLPPSALSVLPKSENYPSLKVITVAGEECSVELVNDWAIKDRRFFNLYGPTETTIWASFYECKQGMDIPPPIGQPVNNTELYVLDSNKQQLPVGMPGELGIGGVGLARGYINRDELTEERFTETIILNHKKKLYLTGDLVKLNNKGQLEFLGRIDRQIKMRGFRIEPGEIEFILKQNEWINNALVIKHITADHEVKLVAYLIVEKDLDISIVKSSLSEHLPNYMVPRDFVLLAEFPLTHNGKIDYKALPKPKNNNNIEGVKFNPQNSMEKLVEEVWANVLSLDNISVNHNFFDIGGHSLKLAQVQSELSEALNREIKLMDLFQYVTIKSLAEFLTLSSNEKQAKEGEVNRMKRNRNRSPLKSLADKKRNARRKK